MLKKLRYLLTAILAGMFFLPNAHGAFMTGVEVGSSAPADINITGTVGDTFENFTSATAYGYVPKFNMAGMVLVGYRIVGTLYAESYGYIYKDGETVNAGGQVAATAGAVVALGEGEPPSFQAIESCLGAGDIVQCDIAFSVNDFELIVPVSKFADVLGLGSVQVAGVGHLDISGGCEPDNGGDCGNVTWNHLGSTFFSSELRVEWAYCNTPGEDDCPEAIPGENTPINGAPEPGTIALLGLGLAGLAASRRRKQ